MSCRNVVALTVVAELRARERRNNDTSEGFRLMPSAREISASTMDFTYSLAMTPAELPEPYPSTSHDADESQRLLEVEGR